MFLRCLFVSLNLLLYYILVFLIEILWYDFLWISVNPTRSRTDTKPIFLIRCSFNQFLWMSNFSLLSTSLGPLSKFVLSFAKATAARQVSQSYHGLCLFGISSGNTYLHQIQEHFSRGKYTLELWWMSSRLTALNPLTLFFIYWPLYFLVTFGNRTNLTEFFTLLSGFHLVVLIHCL